MLKALSDTSSEFQLSDRWMMYLAVYDDNNNVVTNANPVFTVTAPDGTTTNPTVENLGGGLYRVTMSVSTAGRWVAVAKILGNGVANFSAYVSAVSISTDMPTVDDVRDYAADSIGASVEDATIQAVMDSEASQQRARLNIGAVYTPDLFEALCRRTVLALDRRQKLNAGDFSTGILGGDTQAFIPRDPEVTRLEAPYRKVVMI